MYEEETEGQIPFLDTLLIRKEDGNVKLLVYRKKTHTDQYLNFMSHHPLHQKLGVIRTLLNRRRGSETRGGTTRYQCFEVMQLSSLEYPKNKKGHAEDE